MTDWIEHDGVFVTAALAEVPALAHGVTTRALGSLAGSLFPKDEQARNRAALSRRIGAPLVRVKQIALDDIVLVDGARATRLGDGRRVAAGDPCDLEGDALATRDHGVTLAISVADCVPVLVVTREGWLGLAHAGWQGTARGVTRALCRALAQRGADLSRARAAIGPSIGPCCYTIDPLRAAEVRGRIGDDDLAARGGTVAFDLWSANRRQLEAAGVKEIDVAGLCTQDNVSLFFSHRGEKGKAGRGLAFLAWTAPR